jgi:AbrB family looped-hinge helix DNA binding protein
MMHRVTVSARGQIVIPAELRRKMGLSAGTHLRLYESGSRVVLVPEVSDPVAAGFGFLKKETTSDTQR